MKVLLDINAVPPFGVEGIELKDDMREMLPGIFTIGALTVGDLKHKLEKEILRDARDNGKEVYNYNIASANGKKTAAKRAVPDQVDDDFKLSPVKKILSRNTKRAIYRGLSYVCGTIRHSFYVVSN